MRANRGISRIIVLLLVALIVAVAILVYYIGFQPSSLPPPVRITRFSLDSLDIKEGQNTTLRVDIENLNRTRDHQIEYRFNVSKMVLMYAPGGTLLNRVDSYYNYNFTLETTDPSRTKEFTVTGTIHGDVQFSGYLLAFSVYVEGEELQKTWNDLTLTVREK